MKLNRYIIGITTLAIILGPWIINTVYKMPGQFWLISEWPAGDLLQYYGMIVTAVIAIIGLYFTFQDNRREIKEQSRLDKLPYFSITALNYNIHNPLFGTTTEKNIDSKGEKILSPKCKKQEYFYREEKLKSAIIEIKNGKTCIKTKISETDKQLIINGGVAKQQMGVGVIRLLKEPMTYVPFILCNVGSGAALNFRIGFNKLIDDKLDHPLYLSSTSMNVAEEFYLGFYVAHENNNAEGTYMLEIKYSDMFENEYSQACKFIIEKGDNDGISTNIEAKFKQKMCEHGK